MNDRILDALVAAGIDTSPLSLLDHASAQTSTFFALYDQELVYLEGTKSSRVALRDVTRIHSDREGMLRVETSAQTAVTASLLGYDPGRVQTFFQQVRDVTARAKELPVVPLSSKPADSAPGTALPGSSLPGVGKPDLDKPAPSLSNPSLSSSSMPGVSAYTPASGPVTVPPASPVVSAPVAQPALTKANPVQSAPVQSAPVQPAAASQMPTPAQDAVGENAPGVTLTAPSPSASGVSSAVLPSGPPPAHPTAAPGAALMPAGAIRAAVPRPEPVIISSMPPVSALPAFQERAGERNRQAIRAAPVAEVSPSMPSAGTQTTKTQVSDVRTADLPAAAHTQGPLVSVSAASAGQDADLRSELLRRADSVGALARTVGLLAVVLGLAALALAFFQWSGNASLSAIWTLLTGGVGTVALLSFAEALRLLSALARSQQA